MRQTRAYLRRGARPVAPPDDAGLHPPVKGAVSAHPRLALQRRTRGWDFPGTPRQSLDSKPGRGPSFNSDGKSGCHSSQVGARYVRMTRPALPPMGLLAPAAAGRVVALAQVLAPSPIVSGDPPPLPPAEPPGDTPEPPPPP